MTSTSDGVHLRAVVDRWPLVGRTELVERVGEWLADPDGPGIAIVGDAGYGKTAVARAVLDAVAGRVHVIALNAWPGAASVPYSALSNVLVDLPAVEAEGPLAVTRAVAGYVDERRRDRPCVIWVDDAHDVDDTSAGVLSRLVLAGKVRLMLGSRPPTDLPSPLAVLLRGRTERIDLEPLTETEVADLLHAALGAPATLGAARQIWRASSGNPLYVRELVRGRIAPAATSSSTRACGCGAVQTPRPGCTSARWSLASSRAAPPASGRCSSWWRWPNRWPCRCC